MSPFTVHPNEEVYKCQEFGNPFGKDVDLVKMDGYMDPGSHHFFLFNMDTDDAPDDRGGALGLPRRRARVPSVPLSVAAARHYTSNYPQANMGYPLVATNGLMMNCALPQRGMRRRSRRTVSITIYPAKAGRRDRQGRLHLPQQHGLQRSGEDDDAGRSSPTA